MSSLAVQETDLDVQRLVLDVVDRKVRGLDTRIENSLTGGEIERTLDGASTLTLNVHDPKLALLQSGIFDHQVEASLNDARWRLVKVGKQGPDLALAFEDQVVAKLRTFKKARKAARAKMTRAEFVYSLVREAGTSIPFHCPELHGAQSVAGTGDTRKARKALPYQFRRGGTDGTVEDSWTCMQRLASEVAWRCFTNKGAVWFVSEPQLLKAAPAMALTSTDPDVSVLDFDVDYGKVENEVQLQVRASRWAAGPGSVIRLAEVGPADGLWLVHDVRRGLYDADTTITLKRAAKAKPEPAPQLATPQLQLLSGGAAAAATGSAAVDAAYQAAQAIDAKHYPYVWGGGHAHAGTPDGGTGRDPGIGFDCSGSTCAVLAAGGMGFRLGGPAAVSGTLASWGVAGPGEHLTIYANEVHVFMVFTNVGKQGAQHFGTGNWGKSWGGPGFNSIMHPTAGFAARHWPGT